MKTRTIAAAMSVLWLLMTASGMAGQDRGWPQWRGPDHDGRAPAEGALPDGGGRGLKIAWKKELGSGYSSVVVADGVAYTMFSDHEHDYVVALGAESGEERWRYTIDTTYVGHDGSDDGPVSTPAVYGGMVYGLGPKGRFVALSASTGEKVWATHLVDDHGGRPPQWGFATSPIVVGDVLVLQTGGDRKNLVTGFDRRTGEVLWTAGEGTVTYQSPVLARLAGVEQVVCAGDELLLGVRPTTGEVLWRHQHDGGNQSAHPVVLAPDDRLFVRPSRRDGVLLAVDGVGGELALRELWRSPEIRQTFNITVLHDGHLYGYSGRNLACVNADTGALVWKSRAPGDGFLTYVDSHLVVLTKAGTIHLVEATPAGYNEVANLELFDDTSWCLPSFADGRIFVRSVSEIACLELVEMDRPLQLAGNEPEEVTVGSELAAFLNRLGRASDKARMLDEFFAAHGSSPVIEGDGLAHLVFRGEARNVAVRGDMLNFGEEAEMTRVEGTDFFYRSFSLEPDAHLCYQLVRDFEEVIPDPRNPRTVTTFNGEESELAMPRWQAPAHLEEPEGRERGTIERLELQSALFEEPRTLEVYLPPGYEAGETRYPTVYVNYGHFAIGSGRLPNTLDNLIAAGRIVPVIAVFIHAPDSGQEYVRGRRDEYARMVAEELVPFVDGRLRTIPEPGARAIVGGDEGGFSAIYTAFRHPGSFHMVAGQSTHVYEADGDTLRELARAAKSMPIRFYLDWGTYDLRYPQGGAVWADLNRAFAEFLVEQGFEVVSHEVHGGFGWCSWRTRTDSILETFFPASSAE